MKQSRQGKETRVPVTAADFLASVPHRNEAMEITRKGRATVAAVPVRRPSWLVPPISWILPFSSHRRVELDEVGAGVLEMCNGRNTVETIIEKFAADHKLSFREAQLPVTQFLRMLTQRGLVAVVGAGKSRTK
jgi:hypothetical protein